MEGNNEINISEEKKIDIQILAKKIWANKLFIIKTMAISFIIGLIIAFSIPKEYTTTIVLIPDSQSSSFGGSIGSLASLAGLEMGGLNRKDALSSPELYPDIFHSTLFLTGLFDIKVKDSKHKIDTTLYSYLTDYQKIEWWAFIFKAPGALKELLFPNDSDIENHTNNKRILSEKEINTIETLQEKINVSSDKKTGLTTINVTMQSPEISSFLADTLSLYFQSYIIKYRTQKARNDLDYAEKLYLESQKNYQNAQKNLAVFMDGNLNVVSARYKITEERLQNEANLAYSLYNQTAQQLQLARIKVQDDTPVFTIIQSAVQPLYASNPSKKMILIAFILISFIGGCLWILRKDFYAIL